MQGHSRQISELVHLPGGCVETVVISHLVASVAVNYILAELILSGKGSRLDNHASAPEGRSVAKTGVFGWSRALRSACIRTDTGSKAVSRLVRQRFGAIGNGKRGLREESACVAASLTYPGTLRWVAGWMTEPERLFCTVSETRLTSPAHAMAQGRSSLRGTPR